VSTGMIRIKRDFQIMSGIRREEQEEALNVP
jgi:hypothetical protein